jgi:heme/copper-type cytochrome/quinol oxidase subunit 2
MLVFAGSAAFAADEIEIVASKDGFRPKLVKVHRGETTRLKLRSADGEHCFAIDALRIEKRLVPGKTVTVELVPDKVGELPFYSCLDAKDATMKGKLVVVE